MANKSSGKTYVSKGERRSSMKTRINDPGLKLLNQIKALKKGRDVVIKLPNYDKDGKQLENTVLKIDGREWLKKRQNVKASKAEAE
jgi:hypothetical protein